MTIEQFEKAKQILQECKSLVAGKDHSHITESPSKDLQKWFDELDVKSDKKIEVLAKEFEQL